jgi:hypothetical protein
MRRLLVTASIDLLETAYYEILTTVPPGTPGKFAALEKLRQSAHDLYVSFSTHKQSLRTSDLAG